jgi:2-polyprenyl-3-methyl-5-hydroxy-6-metoxy-1,4-benzoquinol methylase
MDRNGQNRAVIDAIYAQYARANAEIGALPDTSEPDAYEDNVASILARYGVRHGDAIVDLACGDGRKLASLGRTGFTALTGVDKHVEAATNGIVHIRQDISDFLDADAAPVKCIILYDILEHLELSEIVALLGKAARRLAGDGIVIVRTPNGASPLSGLYYYGDVTHRTLLNEDSLRQIALVTGLTVDRVLPEGVAGARYSAPKRIAARIGNRILRAGLAVASLLAFRRRCVLTPNFTAVLKRRPGGLV